MTERQFDPSMALGEEIAGLGKQELCWMAAQLCRLIVDEVGNKSYRGGVWPENICYEGDGRFSLGEGHRSDWGKEELRFIPPELYWDGEAGPSGDVYSLGLLLYYGLSGGKLPFEGESPDPQLSRMSGKKITAPAGLGGRLAEILEKACRFKANERYQTLDELRVMLESCEENKYVENAAAGEIFKKDEAELSEVERMMLAIMGGETEAEAPAEAPLADEVEETPASPALSPEEAAELILGEQVPAKPAAPDKAAQMRALMDEIFGSPAPEEDEEDEEEQAMEAEAAPAPPRPIVPEEREDVRVYEPGKEKREHEPIPILTEEKNPELAPIVPNRQPIQYSRDPERSRAIAADVRKRRTRPIGVVLILCGLLIIAALIANYFLQNVKWLDEGRGRSVEVLEADPDAITAEDAFISAEELQRQEEEAAAAARQSYYQVFQEDISWTSAKNSCNNLGGQLAVINNSDEFTMVTQLAQQSGVQGVWVGCHREGGFLVWETTEPVGVMTWADQEPSYTDSRDGAAEDYIMLWNTGSGWAYIDCRNDPVIADGERYAGKIGYVCEFES